MYITKEVEIEVDMDDFSTDEIMEELAERGVGMPDTTLLTKIWMKRRTGQDYQADLAELIYMGIGKIL